jgi:hypothetical protein
MQQAKHTKQQFKKKTETTYNMSQESRMIACRIWRGGVVTNQRTTRQSPDQWLGDIWRYINLQPQVCHCPSRIVVNCYIFSYLSEKTDVVSKENGGW